MHGKWVILQPFSMDSVYSFTFKNIQSPIECDSRERIFDDESEGDTEAVMKSDEISTIGGNLDLLH